MVAQNSDVISEQTSRRKNSTSVKNSTSTTTTKTSNKIQSSDSNRTTLIGRKAYRFITPKPTNALFVKPPKADGIQIGGIFLGQTAIVLGAFFILLSGSVVFYCFFCTGRRRNKKGNDVEKKGPQYRDQKGGTANHISLPDIPKQQYQIKSERMKNLRNDFGLPSNPKL
ncbi:hypothetical protein BY996DRAFT_6408881 [Phakopsora pachyrhizi]|uniref:Expressed protein n=1 Tax=Phakopsora pachyrhizi TaxID=170000 RepID=A0AAV0BIS3_PHAPC|nr:hypothetical protein BY996DRAFT_6408881 [Phakopsora pachyrhizi]CAH7685851.1 expressed protein [Phakopsora pachyrhizi]